MKSYDDNIQKKLNKVKKEVIKMEIDIKEVITNEFIKFTKKKVFIKKEILNIKIIKIIKKHNIDEDVKKIVLENNVENNKTFEKSFKNKVKLYKIYDNNDDNNFNYFTDIKKSYLNSCYNKYFSMCEEFQRKLNE